MEINHLSHLFGLKVVVMPDHPKMQLSADCPCTDSYRAEINAWMIEFFGVTNLIKDGDTLIVNNNSVIMNPRTYQHLMKAVRRIE